MKHVHGGRAMLNLPGHQTTAAIVAEIVDTTDWPEGRVYTWDNEWKDTDKASVHSICPDYTLQISDCDRSVKLTIDLDTEEEHANNVYKIDMLISVLKEFRKGLVKEQKLFLKRKKAIAQAKDR